MLGSVKEKGCPGPLIWYDVEGQPCSCGNGHIAAILKCARCDYLVCSGNFNDEAHRDTEILREGLAQ